MDMRSALKACLGLDSFWKEDTEEEESEEMGEPATVEEEEEEQQQQQEEVENFGCCAYTLNSDPKP